MIELGLISLISQEFLCPRLLQGHPDKEHRATGAALSLHLFQILLLHGHQVAPGDVIFLCTKEKKSLSI